MTLYRVINNEGAVSASTRERILGSLNKVGYYSSRQRRESKTVFDFSGNNYLQHYGIQLMQSLSINGFSAVITDHMQNRTRFFDAASAASSVVFCSEPDSALIDELRKSNPTVFTISMFGNANADVTVCNNDMISSELAARHLHENGHRHILVYRCSRHYDSMKRYKGFCGEMKTIDPSCRIDCVETDSTYEETVELGRYFDSTKPWASAILFLGGAYSHMFYKELVQKSPERFKDLSVLTYDSPTSFYSESESMHKFDCLAFSPEEIIKWIEYFLSNRPMMKCETPIQVQVIPRLEIYGSVRYLKGARQ